MWVFTGIDKTLQSIQGELVNNISILTEIDECIKKSSEKLKEVDDGSTKSEEQR